jgi:predicted enzyme related to lactoylglutathione lyase
MAKTRTAVAKRTAKGTPRAKSAPAKKPVGTRRPKAKTPPVVTSVARAKKTRPSGPVLQSIRSVIFQVDDLERAKEFYSAALGRKPYFDEPFYVGYDVDGQELGLHPDVSRQAPGPGGAVAYWKVDDIAASWEHLASLGGQPLELPHDVGGGIETAIVADPFGNLVGLIQFSN